MKKTLKGRDREHSLTQLLDEYQIRRRAGGKPTVQEYVRRYPRLAEEIRTVFANELLGQQISALYAQWLHNEAPEVQLETEWQKLHRRVTSRKDSVVISILICGFIICQKIWTRSNDGFKEFLRMILSPMKLGAAVVVGVLIAVILIVHQSSIKYADLARIEPVYYQPVSFKGPAPKSTAEKQFARAMKFYGAGQYPQAIEALSKFLVAKPLCANAHFYLGLCYLLSDQVDSSIVHLTKALELDGSILSERSRWYLGNAYLLKEDGEKALAEFEKVVEFEGDYEWEARELLEKIEKIKSNSE